MKRVVPINLIPDLVEELTIDESGVALDLTWARLIINEFDDHAIEQAILLKERHEAEVIVFALDVEGVEDVLFTAAAKGADQLIKLTGDFNEEINSHALARLFAASIKEMQPDLILTGVQAHNDLDGQTGPLLAECLGYPYVGYIAGVESEEGKAVVRKEYPGGLIGEMEVTLPAVLGIQASEEPPRYIAFSKVRQAMKTASIQEREISELDYSGGPIITRMFKPEVGERATMIEGSIDEITSRLLEVFTERGIT